MPTFSPGVLGPPPRDPQQPFWDPEAQTMPREEIRALQTARLRDVVARVLAGEAPLFGRKLADAGITNAEDITDVSDIDGIPLTVKQELRDSEAEFPPFGDYRFTLDGLVRLGTSTGTTGTPTIALWTRKDIWIEYESAARNMWRSGWRPGQIATHSHPAYLYGGGVMLSGTLEYFGALNLWVPPPDTDELAEQAIRMWQRVKPDISLVALSLGRFIEVAAKMGLDLTTDVGLPGFQFQGGGGKALPLFTCGLEAYAYSSGACRHGAGAHLHEDWAVIQAVDPETGREVPEGEWGDLVVTTLDRDNGLLRYDLEEAASITREPCACGETTWRAFWGGRFKDLLHCQGTRFQVSEVENALRAVPEVTTPTLEYVVVKPADDGSPLRVRVELVEGDPDDVRARCVAALKERLGVAADVEIVAREALGRRGYKSVRLVDT
jgi:phenylacetate-CoA ligase